MELVKEFVPHQPSLDMKELGFDEPCFGIWIGRGSKYDVMYVAKQEDAWMAEQNDGILAPTFSQAFRWFREKHELHSHISLGISDEQDRSGLEYDEYIYIIEGLNDLTYDNYRESPFYKTHEEAELACLRKLIEIVKK